MDGRIWPSSSSTSDGAGDADARHGHVNFGTVIRGAPGELAAIARAEAAIGDIMRYQKPRVGPALIWVYGSARA